MDDAEKAKSLLAKGQFRSAAKLLDSLIGRNRNDDSLWYLRGITSLKFRNYDAACQAFNHAIMIHQKPEYWKMKGVTYMEACKFSDAIACFRKALHLHTRDAESNFHISLCYMLLNDPKSREYIQKAYLLDKKKTKEMLKKVYSVFFKPDLHLTNAMRAELEKKLALIPTS